MKVTLALAVQISAALANVVVERGGGKHEPAYPPPCPYVPESCKAPPAYVTVYKPEYKTVYKPEYKTVYKPTYTTVYKPEYKTVYKPEYKTVTVTEHKKYYETVTVTDYKHKYETVTTTEYKHKYATDTVTYTAPPATVTDYMTVTDYKKDKYYETVTDKMYYTETGVCPTVYVTADSSVSYVTVTEAPPAEETTADAVTPTPTPAPVTVSGASRKSWSAAGVAVMVASFMLAM